MWKIFNVVDNRLIFVLNLSKVVNEGTRKMSSDCCAEVVQSCS